MIFHITSVFSREIENIFIFSKFDGLISFWDEFEILNSSDLVMMTSPPFSKLI